jgi:hypothetical protein
MYRVMPATEMIVTFAGLKFVSAVALRLDSLVLDALPNAVDRLWQEKFNYLRDLVELISFLSSSRHLLSSLDNPSGTLRSRLA